MTYEYTELTFASTDDWSHTLNEWGKADWRAIQFIPVGQTKYKVIMERAR